MSRRGDARRAAEAARRAREALRAAEAWESARLADRHVKMLRLSPEIPAVLRSWAALGLHMNPNPWRS